MHITNQNILELTTPSALPDYAGILEVLLGGMSTASRRQYQHTFNDWRVWCADNDLSPKELSAPNVILCQRT